MTKPLSNNVAKLNGLKSQDPLIERLYREHFKSICVNLQRSFGGGPPDPEDIVQSAFVKFASLESKSKINNPRSFIYSIARNLILDHKRASKIADEYIAEQIALDRNISLQGISPERILASREEFNILIKTMQDLPHKQQIILTMSRLEGKSYKQISQETGWSTGDISRNMKDDMSALLKATKPLKHERSE